MRPVSEFTEKYGPLTGDLLRIGVDESLSTLIKLAIDQPGPIVATDNGDDAGVITHQDILQTVIEGTEGS